LGVGAHTEVTIADRPMTMHGLSGMKTGSMGPGRQVYDKTYYTVELRKRTAELSAELETMNNEISEIAEDNKNYLKYEKRYSELVAKVRALEGDLADHNLATDKQRTDTPPEEVHIMYLSMKQSNDTLRAEVDAIFFEKESHKENIVAFNQEINQLARSNEERLNELHPDQHREYELLREENQRLAADLAERRDENEQICERLQSLEGHLQSDQYRMRARQLQDVRREVGKRLAVLEEEAKQCCMSIPEQRELLLAKVKSDNTEIVAAEKRNGELKLERERLKAQINEVTTDTQTSADMQSDQQKYEILFTKDQEMSTFIDSFDSTKAEEEAKLEEKQLSIQRLLESISSTLALSVSPEGHMREMEDELDFKSKQLQNSETTKNQLEGELAKRRGELEKIESLDTKISQELQQVEQKMKQYEEEIVTKFDKSEEVRALGSQYIKSLEARKKALEERMDSLGQQVTFLKLRCDSQRQQLTDDVSAQGLDAQENKIRQFGQILHTRRSFIREKTAESDYMGERTTCLKLTEQLNKLLMERRIIPT